MKLGFCSLWILFLVSVLTHNQGAVIGYKTMNRFRVSLTIALSTLILGGVLLGSVPADACPFSKSNPTAVSPDRFSNSPFEASTRPDQFTEMKIAGAGLATIAGFFMFGLLQRVRRFKQTDSAMHEVFNHYPEVEHPELMLTSVPKEGYSSRLEDVQLSVR